MSENLQHACEHLKGGAEQEKDDMRIIYKAVPIYTV